MAAISDESARGERVGRRVRPVPAVTRAVAILRLLGRSEEALGVHAIARALTLIPSTCLHILRVLVAEGLVAFDPESKRYRAGAGAFAFLPSGIAHTFFVVEDARVLTIAVPGGVEGFFRSVGRPAEGPGMPPPSDIDVDALRQAAARFNTEFVGPPLAPS